MQFTVDAAAFGNALRMLNLRRDMEFYVTLQAKNGKLRLITKTNDGLMQAAFDVTDNVTIEVEGTHAVQYKLLMRTLKTFDGKVTLRREESAMIVSQPGNLTHQSPVDGVTRELTSPPELEGSTYTQAETTYEACALCSTRNSKHHTNTYRINRTVTQTVRATWGSITSLLNRVKWAVSDYDYYHQGRIGILIGLTDDVLSFRSADGRAAVIAREALSGGGSWEHEILSFGDQFVRALRLFPKNAEIVVEATIAEHQQIKSDDEDVLGAPFFKGVVLRLASENLRVGLSLLNEPFPAFPDLSLLPEPQMRVVCSTADLLAAVESVGLTADDSHTDIQLTIGGNQIGIEAQHSLANLPALYEIPVIECTGEPLNLVMTRSHLLAAIQSVPAPQTLIEFRASDQLVLIRANNNQNTYASLVKPARIS